MDPHKRASVCSEYVFRVLLEEPFEAVRAHIHYGTLASCPEGFSGVCIIPSGFFDTDYGTSGSVPPLPLADIEGTPILYGTPCIRRRDDRLVVQADIIASAYFLLTRYEEVVRRDVRDEHGRFPGRQSLSFRAGFLDRPIVEEYADLLRGWLAEVGIGSDRTRRDFTVLLTHDVDTLRKHGTGVTTPARNAVKALLGRTTFAHAAESLAVSIGLRKDPFYRFDEMIRLDAGLRGDHPEPTYFFMVGGDRPEDCAYKVTDRLARRTIRKIVASGAVVGLHASYDAGLHPDRLATEVEVLTEVCGRPIRRNRHHFLAWREVEDGWLLVRAGIDWDSSLGYADVPGFRLGVCRPVSLFDPVRLEEFGIQEHPLIVMDCQLSWEKYFGLDEEAAFEYCRRLIDRTREHDGEFVMLWHNPMLAPEHGGYHPRLYRRLLHLLGDVSTLRE